MRCVKGFLLLPVQNLVRFPSKECVKKEKLGSSFVLSEPNQSVTDSQS